MVLISTLRTLVKNGWNIANRRNIVSKIGVNNFRDIVERALKTNIFDSFEYSKAIKYIKPNKINETKKILDDIYESYRKYAQSPYINEELRKGLTLTEKSKQIVTALKRAITENKVSGSFVRGLTPTKTNRLETIDDVAEFIFENKGFTSVVPIKHAEFANCFAIGKNGTKVIFDIKSMPGYQANNYEVLFDTEAFTHDKFIIEKIGERLYKIKQK